MTKFEDSAAHDGILIGSQADAAPKRSVADDSLSAAIKQSRLLIEESHWVLAESLKVAPGK